MLDANDAPSLADPASSMKGSMQSTSWTKTSTAA